MSKETVKRFLELQEQGIVVSDKIAIELGYGGKDPARTLRNDLRRNKYYAVDGIYVKKDMCADNSTDSNTSKQECTHTGMHSNTLNQAISTNVQTPVRTIENNKGSNEKCADNSADNRNQKSNTLDNETINKLLILSQNFDSIMSNTSSNTFGDAFKITSCKSPTAQTIKVDHEIWNKFRKFAKTSDYKQQDLLTTALELLMEQMSQ